MILLKGASESNKSSEDESFIFLDKGPSFSDLFSSLFWLCIVNEDEFIWFEELDDNFWKVMLNARRNLMQCIMKQSKNWM